MRHTGKLYTLTLVSCFMTVIAASMLVFWNEDTAWWHLWFDIVPQGLGMASVITTTLIVSVRTCRARPRSALIAVSLQAMIASVVKEDLAVATGSMSESAAPGKFVLTRHILQLLIFSGRLVKCSV